MRPQEEVTHFCPAIKMRPRENSVRPGHTVCPSVGATTTDAKVLFLRLTASLPAAVSHVRRFSPIAPCWVVFRILGTTARSLPKSRGHARRTALPINEMRHYAAPSDET